MDEPAWLTPSAGRRLADCAAAEVKAVARQIGWLEPPPGPASAAERSAPRVNRAIRAAEAAAAAAAEAAAQATIASQALLAAVKDQGPITPKKPRVRKEATSTEKHAVAIHQDQGSAFPAEEVKAFLAAKEKYEAEKASHPGEQEAVPATATRKAYATRGTAGTYQGKRPPKDPEKLKAFMAAKAKYEAEKAELRKSQRPVHRRPSPNQEEYRAWQKTFARAKAASSREQFIEAAVEWRKKRARSVTKKHAS